MQFRVFWGNLSANTGNVKGTVAGLDSGIFSRAGSLRGISWEVVNEHHSLHVVFLSSTVSVRRSTYQHLFAGKSSLPLIRLFTRLR